MSESTQAPLTPAMEELVQDFQELEQRDRLQLLLELSNDLPGLPERYGGRLDELERVDECQSPVFLTVEVADDEQRTVNLFIDAPAEAPTTRGFAGILHTGLNGVPAQDVLDVPEDAPYRFGLSEAVSPLRMRGMVGMLSRIKRQVHMRMNAAPAAAESE